MRAYHALLRRSRPADVGFSLVLISERKISTMRDLLPVLELIAKAQKPLVIIADDIDGTIHEYEITYPEGHLGEKKQVLTRKELLKNIREAGRTPVERDSLYDAVPEREELERKLIPLPVLQPA